jgi:hypothetical protein
MRRGANERRGDLETLERRRHALRLVRYRRDERQTADLLGMVQCQRQRDGSAHRVADDQRSLKPERLAEAGDRICLSDERRRRVRGPCGIAAAGPIQNDDAVIALQPVEQRMREIEHLAGEIVNQEKRRARAFVEVVEARAVNIDEAAARRHSLFHLPRCPGGKQHESDDKNSEKRDADPDDPGDDAHFLDLRARKFQ